MSGTERFPADDDKYRSDENDYSSYDSHLRDRLQKNTYQKKEKPRPCPVDFMSSVLSSDCRGIIVWW